MSLTMRILNTYNFQKTHDFFFREDMRLKVVSRINFCSGTQKYIAETTLTAETAKAFSSFML